MLRSVSLKQNRIFWLLLVAFVGLGAYLFVSAQPAKVFSDEQLIRDAIWLDGWAVFFFVLAVVIWCLKTSWKVRFSLVIASFSLYAVVTISLILNGTPYSLNAFWGDQQFRQAMVLKFASLAKPGDFYYRDLPPFYPPAYYYLLSLYSRLFSVEAYKMLKIGGLLIYAAGPFLHFFFWKKLVSPFQAFFVTLSLYLLCSFGPVTPLAVPHAFLADSLFVPWWLLYIEQVKGPTTRFKHYLVGGLIGALLFCTYFYGFFIGGVLLLLRTTVFARWRFIRQAVHFSMRRASGVLVTAAVLSAPYWLPLFISIANSGIDRSRGGWHDLASTGLLLQFLEFSLLGLLFLTGILYAVRRAHVPLYKGMLLLAGVSIVYLGVGSVLGSVGIPINLVKVRQFVTVAAGPFVGLTVAGLVRREFMSRKRRRVITVLASLLLLVFLHNFASVAKQEETKTARTARVPTWNTNSEEMAQRKGAIFLTGNPELPSFYPVYCFLTTNEHYSHPASRYKQRYDFLNLLQGVGDPYLFHAALRHNVFDAVDYFMPHKKDTFYQVLANVSNYPNGLYTKTLRFPPGVVADSFLFVKQTGDHLFAVVDRAHRPEKKKYDFETLTTADSILFLARMRLLEKSLDEVGRSALDRYLDVRWEPWHQIASANDSNRLAAGINLLGAWVAETTDSLYLVMALQPSEDFALDYKVFCHVYQGAIREQFDNLDFAPVPKTSTWKKWDIVFSLRALPNTYEEPHLHVGLYREQKRLGDGFWARPALK
ncbi:MAG TPA: arabinofuranosyltransferase [Candidatus Deferrimicrobium sp.]|nr:arabinofuranosyltransferase [Candidatus Deferrimicrobium sp.]